MILLGDFNIVSPEHKTMKALTDNDFVAPKALQENPTTETGMHYDQIAFKTKPEVVEYTESRPTNPLRCNAGVVPLFEKVFANRQFDKYSRFVKKSTAAGKKARGRRKLRDVYKDWRTYQFSDHFPMWVRPKTDGSGSYLNRMSRE